MPVHLIQRNETRVIVQILGDDKLKAHLANLGFLIGEPITLVNKVNENVILKVKGVSLGISKELAKRILV